MFARAPRLSSRSLPVQRGTDTSSSTPPITTPSAVAQPRLSFASLSIHSPARRAGPLHSDRRELPVPLKRGIEALSGLSMDGVKVHHDSPRPARLRAHAFTQGREIHLAPGQKHHLPHEAWHVVQQAQGRVRPTMQMKGGASVNDDAALEREADEMGARALTLSRLPGTPIAAAPTLEPAAGAKCPERAALSPLAAARTGPCAAASAVVQRVNGDDEEAEKAGDTEDTHDIEDTEDTEDTEDRSLPRTFFRGVSGGFRGVFDSLASVPNRANFAAASRQSRQLLRVARRPVETARQVASDVTPHLGNLDVGQSAASTGGDIAGSALALGATAALGTFALRKPYLRSRVGRQLLSTYRSAPILQGPILQNPRVAGYVVTRPLSAVVGAGAAAGAFYGSASARESDARENREEHPEISAALEESGVDELAASILRRAAAKRKKRSIRKEEL